MNQPRSQFISNMAAYRSAYKHMHESSLFTYLHIPLVFELFFVKRIPRVGYVMDGWFSEWISGSVDK